MLDKWDLCFVIYMFLSNKPPSGGGDINLSNLSCCNTNNTQYRTVYEKNPVDLRQHVHIVYFKIWLTV